MLKSPKLRNIHATCNFQRQNESKMYWMWLKGKACLHVLNSKRILCCDSEKHFILYVPFGPILFSRKTRKICQTWNQYSAVIQNLQKENNYVISCLNSYGWEENKWQFWSIMVNCPKSAATNFTDVFSTSIQLVFLFSWTWYWLYTVE